MRIESPEKSVLWKPIEYVLISLGVFHEYLGVNLSSNIVDCVNQTHKAANHACGRCELEHEVWVYPHVGNSPGGTHRILSVSCLSL